MTVHPLKEDGRRRGVSVVLRACVSTTHRCFFRYPFRLPLLRLSVYTAHVSKILARPEEQTFSRVRTTQHVRSFIMIVKAYRSRTETIDGSMVVGTLYTNTRRVCPLVNMHVSYSYICRYVRCSNICSVIAIRVKT